MGSIDPLISSMVQSALKENLPIAGGIGDAAGVATGASSASQVREDGFVHHGFLLVDRTIDAQFRKAETYLRGDSIMRKTLDGLEHSKTPTFIVDDEEKRTDIFHVESRTIDWDPYRAFRTSDGGRVSPALVLGHELSHAIADPKTQAKLGKVEDDVFKNAEERRVVNGPERHAALTLGEAVRRDYEAHPYHVRSSTSRY